MFRSKQAKAIKELHIRHTELTKLRYQNGYSDSKTKWKTKRVYTYVYVLSRNFLSYKDR